MLGIGAEVSIDISNKGMFFTIKGDLFGWIQANVSVSAPYGKKGDMKEAEFSVSWISALQVMMSKEQFFYFVQNVPRFLYFYRFFKNIT